MTIPYQNNWAYISDELRWLDMLLHIKILQSRQQQNNHVDFKGLVVTDDEVDGLLSENNAPSSESKIQDLIKQLDGFDSQIQEKRRESMEQEIYLSLPHLSYMFQLTPFDERVIMLCLAPELDRKYERIYAYLQDDVTQKKPSVNLALSLFCNSEEEKLAARSFFLYDSPLIRCMVLQLGSGLQDVSAPFLSLPMKLDNRIVNFLLGFNKIDQRLNTFANVIEPQADYEEIQVSEEIKSRLMSITQRHFQKPGNSDEKLVCMFQGGYGTGKREMAEAICTELGIKMIVADVAVILNGRMDFEEALWLLFRESLLLPGAIYLDGFEHLLEMEQNRHHLFTLVKAFESFSILTFLDSQKAWEPIGEFKQHFFITVEFTIPHHRLRKAWWAKALENSEFSISPDVDLDELVSKFQLSGSQISDALVKARDLAFWRNTENGKIQMGDIITACRAKSNQNLRQMAQRIEPKYTRDDIVLPLDQMDQLNEICAQHKYRYVVYEQWGFDNKLSHGKGLNVLFSGPSGTGKTMAAEVIANQLQLDLYKIDLSQVVSKYIGETEKNLDRIFREAYGSNAILFFDEADALFGKRSEVKDAHDRYANIEIGYLLQKMEEYDGIAILATNLRKNIDEAFVRRMHFIVEFPFPDEENRRKIWEVMFPQNAPLSDDVDFAVLAREVKLAGGNIKNIAVMGAFCAVNDGGVIKMAHLIHATTREYQKLGQAWDGGESEKGRK